ncbi:MAG: ParB N-terminal domain-containing protein [Clostridia bacterium]|nr:ParB N-terminal domain-containing protein [Clostridia bacterium]
MSKLDKLEQFNFMPDAEQTARNNRNLSEMFRGALTDYEYLPLGEVAFNEENDYAESDNEESIRKLADDIRRNGLLHNIVVSHIAPGKYKLLSGERRLRAYQLLEKETGEEKYRTIYALVKRNLTPTQELIILDAANLQTRGTPAEEKKLRKAGLRFIENLKTEFGISDEEAIRLTKEYSDVTGKTIDRNILLERDLDKALLALLDAGEISKNDAIVFAQLDAQTQIQIAAALRSARADGEAALQQKSSELSEMTKENKTLKEDLERREGELTRIKAELETAQGAAKLMLEQQRALYEQSVTRAKNRLQENKRAIEAAGKGSAETNAEKTERTLRAELILDMSRAVKKLELGVIPLAGKITAERLQLVDEVGRQTLLLRLREAQSRLQATIDLLETQK